MHIGRRTSVRASLTWAITLTIIISWMLSSGLANYLNYLSMKTLHQQMLDDPMTYPRPFPEPRFDIWVFITGRPNMPPPDEPSGDKQTVSGADPSHQKQQNGHHDKGPANFPIWIEIRGFLVRLMFAIGLASVTASWIARRYTKPLNALTSGVEAYQAGNYDYRVPTGENNEFDAVATAMNNMADQVNRHIQRLEDDAKRRKQFLANIAHEFRSPVTTMRTMAGALQDGMADEPDRRKRALDALVGNSERLLRLVQDLMELARLDLDHFTLDKHPVELVELLKAVVPTYTATAQQHGITLHPLEADGVVMVDADKDRILQAVDNVIGNAISHAGRGCDLWVKIIADQQITIMIQDNGKGIKPEHLPYLCDPFYRADTARTPGDKHSGLGLSIASRLLEAHGGRLEIDSEDGVGTSVRLVIPAIQ
ncbi:MAG: sensor histidine kinase [Armatimonadota bacterium]